MSPVLKESSNAAKGINVECPEHGFMSQFPSYMRLLVVDI